MKKINIGCETYTWQMPGEQYKGKLEHIMAISQQAGFKGIEPETSFIGHLSDPSRMKAALDQHQLDLPVLCLAEDWQNPNETAAEKARADQWIAFLKHFPETIFLLVQIPGKDRERLKERQQNLLSCVNQIAQRATEAGIICSYHPNSPSGSIFRTEEDYKVLLNGLHPNYIKYTPDIGHIARGGMDPLAILRQYWSLVNCIHYKDMYQDGRWAPLGQGDIDMEAITQELKNRDFQGWIIVEDECDQAITDPDQVTLNAGHYVEETMRPILAA
ncbi:MAG: sugar phosphate isomerase/epimerase family protein [Saprospiraceae bacterium]